MFVSMEGNRFILALVLFIVFLTAMVAFNQVPLYFIAFNVSQLFFLRNLLAGTTEVKTVLLVLFFVIFNGVACYLAFSSSWALFISLSLYFLATTAGFIYLYKFREE